MQTQQLKVHADRWVAALCTLLTPLLNKAIFYKDTILRMIYTTANNDKQWNDSSGKAAVYNKADQKSEDHIPTANLHYIKNILKTSEPYVKSPHTCT